MRGPSFVRLAYQFWQRCQWCNCRLTLAPNQPNTATRDHILAASRSGEDTVANSALACLACNGKKADEDWGLPPFGPQWGRGEAVPHSPLEAKKQRAARERCDVWQRQEDGTWKPVAENIKCQSRAERIAKRFRFTGDGRTHTVCVTPLGQHPAQFADMVQ